VASNFSSAKFQPLAAKLRNSAIGLQQCFLRRRRPRQTITFGSNDVDFGASEMVSKARTSSSSGWAILRRTALHHVADVDVFALQSHGFDHLRQQFFPRARRTANLARLHRRPGLRPRKSIRPWDFRRRKTILCRVLCSLQRVHSPKSSRVLSSESPVIFSTDSKSDGPAITGSDAILGLTGVMRGAVFCNAGFPVGLGKVSSF